MSGRWLRLYAHALPAAVLCVSFIAVCIQAGTPSPWFSVVHEDGHRTLLQTIFYFEHATRELLLDAMLAVAVAGAVRWVEAPLAESPALVRTRRRYGAVTIASLALILGGTAVTDGGHAILQNLAQLHTREGAPLMWGAHWRYHFVERSTDIALCLCLAGILRRDSGLPPTGSPGLFLAAVGLFGAASALFGFSAAPFRDPTYVGHALRELLTNVLVTLPLAVGGCLLLARRFAVAIPVTPTRRTRVPVVVAGILALAGGTFLLLASVLLGARSHGQKTALAELIFPHFFEHTLGYVFVASCAGWLYLHGAARRR